MSFLVFVSALVVMVVLVLTYAWAMERSDRRAYRRFRSEMGPVARSVCDPLFGYADRQDRQDREAAVKRAQDLIAAVEARAASLRTDLERGRRRGDDEG